LVKEAIIIRIIPTNTIAKLAKRIHERPIEDTFVTCPSE